MSKLIRILLSIAFVIFLAGVIWSFVLISHKKKDTEVHKNDTKPEITITTSVTTTQPAAPTGVAPAAPAQGVVNNTASTKKTTTRRRVTYTIIYDNSSSAGAWASSGVNPDGSTYAYSHAE